MCRTSIIRANKLDLTGTIQFKLTCTIYGKNGLKKPNQTNIHFLLCVSFG